MKKCLFAIIFNGFLIISCQDKSPNIQIPNSGNSDTETVSSENVHLEINNPLDIVQTDYIAFQVSHVGPYERRDSYSYEKSSDYNDVSSVGGKCWNLLFYNTKSQNYYLLEPTKKFLIYDYQLNDTAKGVVVRNLARYDIQFDDNKDGKFTNADAKRLFVSNRLGKGFHQVSPEDASVRNYKFSPKENFIIIYGIKDTNRDGLFDNKDRVYVYRLDLNQAAENMASAQLLVPKAFQDSLQKRVETEWKLPKD